MMIAQRLVRPRTSPDPDPPRAPGAGVGGRVRGIQKRGRLRLPQRRGHGLLVSPPLSLGHRAVPLVVGRAVATVREGCAQGRIGCFGCAIGLQPRSPISPAVRDQWSTGSGRAVERQSRRRPEKARANAPDGAARGGTSCSLLGLARGFVSSQPCSISPAI
jgi:hypothetical protein